jgi:hypothetical protein
MTVCAKKTAKSRVGIVTLHPVIIPGNKIPHPKVNIQILRRLPSSAEIELMAQVSREVFGLPISKFLSLFEK